jgi:histidinol phosphatase-like enzyme (inositol monophosphatase family)
MLFTMIFCCPEHLILIAEQAVHASSIVIRSYFRRPVEIGFKSDSSPVTIADREAEIAIRSLLESKRPGDGVWGEELGKQAIEAEYVWVIDPIDGTTAFLAGRPSFVTLLACLYRGTPILGIINQPIIHDTWVGAAGHPTLLNNRPVAVCSSTSLAEAVLGTTSPDLFYGNQSTAFAQLQEKVSRTIYGGDGYTYGLLAAGFIDLVVEANLKLHDFSALIPVVIGAGGIITDWQGKPLGLHSNGCVIAAASATLHREALELLNQ